MKIHFCGAAETTTGSQHLLEVNGKRILLDCGMYQGHREDQLRVNREFPYFDPKSVDCVVLSHAHIDHSGNLPNLVKKGFKGFVYTTYGTRDLCSIMLADAARIQESDCKFLNKMDRRKGGDGCVAQPIYTEQDAEAAMRRFLTLGYHMPIPIADGVTLTFYDAGHILGAAQVVLDIDDKEDGCHKRLLFSGDVGRGDNELLRDPEAVPNVDIMLMESTYGGRFHEAPAKDPELFISTIKKAMKRGGNVYIPAFAVERTQQLLYLLNRAYREGKLPNYQVYVDSPMAVSATEIFRIHPECFNQDVYNFLFNERDPFGFEQLHMVRTVSESQRLNNLREQAIIISASGMCEAGRILHHLKNGISRDKNTVLFVGYCAANTLGRRIMDGALQVRILGDEYPVRAKIQALDSFSGHADHNELLAYFTRTGGSKNKVYLVHGEKECTAALKSELEKNHAGEVHVAHLNTCITC
ncbi:MAG: MBL fold metallo-hydrolase [Akkermansia sp.]|nr:MBL fold metallo-hydrolase [Akkermansia sp.]